MDSVTTRGNIILWTMSWMILLRCVSRMLFESSKPARTFRELRCYGGEIGSASAMLTQDVHA